MSSVLTNELVSTTAAGVDRAEAETVTSAGPLHQMFWNWMVFAATLRKPLPSISEPSTTGVLPVTTPPPDWLATPHMPSTLPWMSSVCELWAKAGAARSERAEAAIRMVLVMVVSRRDFRPEGPVGDRRTGQGRRDPGDPAEPARQPEPK